MIRPIALALIYLCIAAGVVVRFIDRHEKKAKP